MMREGAYGYLHAFAGNGTQSFSGDGGPAVQATFNFPSGVDVAGDGTVYIADSGNARIRRVSTDGVITTVAGTGPGCCSGGNEGPATSASLGSQTARVRVGPDGSIYILEPNGNSGNGGDVRRVSPDGIIHAFAGNGAFGFAGDGGPATAATFEHPADIAVGPDGRVYISDGNGVVRKVDASGAISSVAGQVAGGAVCSFNASASGDNGPAAAACQSSPKLVALRSYRYGTWLGPTA